MKNIKPEQNQEDTYKTLSLIKDLKSSLQKIIGKSISDEKLSIFLGQADSHITRKKQQIKKAPDYIISQDILDDYIRNLESTFAASCIDFIEKYIRINNVPKVSKGVLKHHPNLKISYFKDIDTKEKAYWLGFIFADGSICSGQPLQFQVEISEKDEVLIDKLANAIGFNLEYKKEIKRDKTIRLRFKNNKFAQFLLEHGMIIGKEKSKNIELPKLDEEKLYLAFLLGYFDGDGKQGTTSIKSGSNKILEQIKDMFNLETKISQISYRLKNGEIGNAYDFWLGGKLFNLMLDNYKNSLNRKRKRFEVYEDESQRFKVMSFKSSMNRIMKKIGNTTTEQREYLTQYAWKFGKKHNFSFSLINKLCRSYNLKSPSKEDWINPS